MLDFGRSSKASFLARLALLAFAPIGIAGCGGDDEPTQSSADAPAAAPAGHGVASATPAGGHGAPMAHGGHGAPGAHGAPNPVASADPHGMHASSAGAHGAHGADSSAAMPNAAVAGAHAAHGTPGGPAVAAHGAHGAGSSAGPSASHDSSGQVTPGVPMPHAVPSSVPTAHDAGGLVTSGGAAAHSGPAGSPAPHGVPVASDGSSAGAVAGHGAPTASGAGVAGGHAQSAVPGVGAVDPSGAPAGHGQMAPGAAATGVPEGYAGSDIPGATAPQQKFEEGTAEYAVQQLVIKMQTGNTEELDKLISDKTKDAILQPLLEGKADEEQIQKNKELVAGATLASRRDSGSSKLFVVNNAEGKVLTFTARKDDEAYKVVNIRVETPRGLKARQQQPGF